MHVKSVLVGGVLTVATVCGWGLAYLSGVFPYLGHAAQSESLAQGSNAESRFDITPPAVLFHDAPSPITDHRATTHGASL